jgi:hypothetical protein
MKPKIASVNRLVTDVDEQTSRDRAERFIAGPDDAPTRHRSVGPTNIMQRCYPSQIRQSTVDIGDSTKISGRIGTEVDSESRPAARGAGRRRGDVTRTGPGRGRAGIVPWVLGEILGCGPGRRRGRESGRPGRRDRPSRARRPALLGDVSRGGLRGPTASPPVRGIEDSVILCPMNRARVKNAVPLAGGPARLRRGRPGPRDRAHPGWHPGCRPPSASAPRSRAIDRPNGR